MKHKIIAIAGNIGSGKDTVGDYLVKNHGFKRMSFAGVMKDAMASMFGWDRKMLDGTTEESREWRNEIDEWWTEKLDLDQAVTPRWMMQNFGTEVVRRNLHDNFWIFALQRQIELHDGPVVITDGRFLNELYHVHEWGGQVWGIHRRQPDWLRPFYREVEKGGLTQEAWSQLNLANEKIRMDLLGQGRLAMAAIANRFVGGVPIHESEWQFTLWNDYDLMIDNRTSLPHTFDQVEARLQGKDK